MHLMSNGVPIPFERFAPMRDSSALIDDPDGLLEGQGAQVRSLKLPDLAVLDDPKVQALMQQALQRTNRPIDPAQPSRSVVKSVSPNQRRRRP